jgi:hypothetical protein
MICDFETNKFANLYCVQSHCKKNEVLKDMRGFKEKLPLIGVIFFGAIISFTFVLS